MAKPTINNTGKPTFMTNFAQELIEKNLTELAGQPVSFQWYGGKQVGVIIFGPKAALEAIKAAYAHSPKLFGEIYGSEIESNMLVKVRGYYN